MELIELLPLHYADNEKFKELQAAITTKFNDLDTGKTDVINEFLIDTASHLLSRYEKIYGLDVDVTKNDAFRRERIRAKIKGIGTVTKQMIIDTSAAYSNGEVEVIENNSNNGFKIKFVGTLGLPANMADLTLTIEEIKPAHLSYTFEYVYRTHSQLSAYTHEQLSTYTYSTLREGAM